MNAASPPTGSRTPPLESARWFREFREAPCPEGPPLSRWVVESMRGLAGPGTPTQTPSSQNADSLPQVHPLLAVLVYCYASGHYSSRDIARRINHDGLLSLLAGGGHWDAEGIRKFRRESSEALLGCLARTLDRVFGAYHSGRYESTRSLLLPGADPDTFQASGPELESTPVPARESLVTEEARRRIGWAMFLDHWESQE